MTKKIFSSLETVDIPSLRVKDIVAKIDTGAWSGALHCTNIVEKDGMLFFTPLGERSLRTSTADYVKKNVRSASGHAASRYVIPIEVMIEGQLYSTQIGLSNRRLMRREMLIGRRFLLEHGILVDVSLSREDDIEAENDL